MALASWLFIAAAAAGICGITIRRPARWLWRRNITEPVGRWFRHLIETTTRTVVRQENEPLHARLTGVEAEVAHNGGHSLKDRVTGMEASMAEMREQLNAIVLQLGTNTAITAAIREHQQ